MSQLEKNTVSSKDQLNSKGEVQFINKDGKGKRIMFVGNSITLHGVLPEIGWHHAWGMAASSLEKDYIHIIMNEVRKTDADAAFCVAQVANWEREYKNGEKELYRYEEAGNFGADIIILRFVENCPGADMDFDKFEEEYKKLMQFLDKENKAKFIITTGFWHHPGDDTIRKIAKDMNLPLVELGDLGELDEMKAVGLFEHQGVANHPGDKGMEHIAKRILAQI